MATYSFLDVQCSIVGPGGAFQLGAGAATSEEGITVEMNADKDTMTIGADGEGMHSLVADKSGTVTISLLKTSPVNQQLRIMYDLQTTSSSLHGKNVITVANSAGDISTAREVAFKKLPVFKYAKEGGFNVWAFNAVKIDGFLGTYS